MSIISCKARIIAPTALAAAHSQRYKLMAAPRLLPRVALCPRSVILPKRYTSSRPVPQTPDEIERDVERRLQAIKLQREEDEMKDRELSARLEREALEARAGRAAPEVQKDENEKQSSGMASSTSASTSTIASATISTFNTANRLSTSSPPSGSRNEQSPTLAALQTQASVQAQELAQRLQRQINDLRGTLAVQRQVLGSRAKTEFAQLGGRINHITGYDEVERLKDEVVRRESEIGRLRTAAKAAKLAYEQAVHARSTSQRDVTSLLERKHLWTDADVSKFTALVRSDHTSNNLVHTTSVELEAAEQAVDSAFSELMKSILKRYHEEQVWSDKIRNLSTYAGVLAIAANLIVFLTAIVVVEPWKRRKLVAGLEERVEGMMSRMESVIGDEIERVELKIGAIHDKLETNLQVTHPQPPTILPATPTEPTPTLVDSSTPPSHVSRAVQLVRAQLDHLAPASPERDLAAVGAGSALTGAAVVGILSWLLRS